VPEEGGDIGEVANPIALSGDEAPGLIQELGIDLGLGRAEEV
jgi:hypothetical protein